MNEERAPETDDERWAAFERAWRRFRDRAWGRFHDVPDTTRDKRSGGKPV